MALTLGRVRRAYRRLRRFKEVDTPIDSDSLDEHLRVMSEALAQNIDSAVYGNWTTSTTSRQSIIQENEPTVDHRFT